MLVTYLLKTEPRNSRLVRSVKTSTLYESTDDSKYGIITHISVQDQHHIVMVNAASEITELNTVTGEANTSEAGWKAVNDPDNRITGFYRKICRPTTSAIMVHVERTLEIKIVRADRIVGSLNLVLSDINAEGSNVFYGEHLWFNDKILVFRLGDGYELVQFLWADIDKDIFDKPQYLKIPQVLSGILISDVWLDDSIMLILFRTGDLIQISQKRETTKVFPPISEEFLLWSNPTRLPNRNILVSTIGDDDNKLQTVYLTSPSFKLKSCIEVKFTDDSEFNTIERFEPLFWSRRQRLVMAIFNHVFVSLILLKKNSLSFFQKFLTFRPTRSSTDALTELIRLNKKKCVFLFGVGNSVQIIKVLLK